MVRKISKRQIGTLIVLFIAIFAFSHVWLLGGTFVLAGEAFESPDDFEDVIGYVEWDSWGNFSATPDQNPPPSLALSANLLKIPPAQRLLSVGRCEAVEIHETYLLANFRFGTKAYARYSVNNYRQITEMTFGLSPLMLMQTEDEGGWELSDKEISLFSGTEEDLVERGPSMAGSTRNLITIRPNGTDGMAFSTLPSKSNYSLDNKANFYGYGLEAGGDQSLNDIGQAIAEASGVTFYNVVNSTQECIVSHNDEDDVIELVFVTYDQVSEATSKAASSMASILTRFTSRIGVAASKVKQMAKTVATAPYKGLSFVAGKAKTIVSTATKTAVNTLKAGVTFIPKMLKGLTKWILIPVLFIGLLVGLVLLKKFDFL